MSKLVNPVPQNSPSGVIYRCERCYPDGAHTVANHPAQCKTLWCPICHDYTWHFPDPFPPPPPPPQTGTPQRMTPYQWLRYLRSRQQAQDKQDAYALLLEHVQHTFQPRSGYTILYTDIPPDVHIYTLPAQIPTDSTPNPSTPAEQIQLHLCFIKSRELFITFRCGYAPQSNTIVIAYT